MQALAAICRPALRAFLALLLAFALVTPSLADAATDRQRLDPLFMLLKTAPDATTATEITGRIWAVWLTPSDTALNARMHAIIAAREAGDIIDAVKLLDKLVIDYPDYAEGWNQRATLHYMARNFDAALADIEKTLALEPRHFGALSGRAMIHLAQKQRPLAIKDMVDALAINPFLSERALFPELMHDIVRI